MDDEQLERMFDEVLLERGFGHLVSWGREEPGYDAEASARGWTCSWPGGVMSTSTRTLMTIGCKVRHDACMHEGTISRALCVS